MNKKIVGLLFTLLLSVSFMSCSKSDNTTSSYDQGKAKGTEFYTSYTSYKTAGSDAAGTLTKASAGLTMYTDYQAYKSSTDQEWKNGFLAGAGLSATQGDALSNLSGISDTATGYVSLANSIATILTTPAQ
jgi:hypothetical protein